MKQFKFALLCTMALTLSVGAEVSHGQLLDQQDPLTPLMPEMGAQRPAEPLPVVNQKLVGWKEPVIDGGVVRMSETLSAHWVQLDATSGVKGRVVGITDPIDVFLLRSGFVVSSATTLADGSYRFEACTPGIYTIVGYSREAVFASGFLAVANDGTAVGLPMELVNRPVLGAANNTLVAKLIQEFSPDVNFRQFGVFEIGEGPEDPPQFFGFEGLANLQDPAIPSVAIQAQPIALAPGGRLVGRIHQSSNLTGRPVEVLSTRVLIVQDGEVLAEVQVDNAGVFEITDLIPGDYGMVAVGADGIATLGLKLVAGTENNSGVRADSNAAFTKPQFFMQVGSTTMQDAGAAGATMIGPESTGWLNNYLTTQVYINELNDPRPELDPNAYGAGFGGPYDYFNQGGGGGGGGSGGYFGGGGNWILPLGIGALIFTATDDNGFNNAIILPPQSPF